MKFSLTIHRVNPRPPSLCAVGGAVPRVRDGVKLRWATSSEHVHRLFRGICIKTGDMANQEELKGEVAHLNLGASTKEVHDGFLRLVLFLRINELFLLKPVGFKPHRGARCGAVVRVACDRGRPRGHLAVPHRLLEPRRRLVGTGVLGRAILRKI